MWRMSYTAILVVDAGCLLKTGRLWEMGLEFRTL